MVSAYNNSIYGLVIVLVFLAILTAGFVFEIGKGALKINSRQSNNLNNIYISSSSHYTKKGFNNKLNLNLTPAARRYLSTYNNQLLEHDKSFEVYLDPNFITGFSDGDSTFTVSIYKRDNKIGWGVQIAYSIELHHKDMLLLEQIKNSFGVGNIIVRNNSGKRSSQPIYSVKSVKDLTSVIIPHFDKYPLLTQKRADLKLFKSIIDIINRKEHLTMEGLRKIVAIRASMNKGLSE